MKMNNNLYEEYTKVENEKRYIRDMIDGLLNRISVTDNEDERMNAVGRIDILVIDYVEKSKIAHKLFCEIYKILKV